MVGTGAGRKLCVTGGGVDCFGLTLEQCTARRHATQCLPVNAAAWDAENADLGPAPFSGQATGYAKKTNCQGGEELWQMGGLVIDMGGVPVGWSAFFDVKAGVWMAGPDLVSGPVDFTDAVVLDNELYRTGGLNLLSPTTPVTGERLIRCSGCFSWPMFMPAIIGERVK